MTRCPKCGNPVAIVFDRYSPRNLTPMATLSCFGDGVPSCGWWLYFWVPESEIESVIRKAEDGQIAA